jgi:tetratricopeptide (TPR) repeat protein
VLKRNPRHFGALSGAGMVHLALEQYEDAQRSFRRALEVNPNMVGVELELLRLEERLKAGRKRST